MLYDRVEEKKKRRIADEEFFNREGHWTRDFSVRSESWPIIEHWASEMGYRMVAFKGRRRLYQKGSSQSTYQTFVEVRHDEGRVVLCAWITVGFALRALTFFLLPSVLPIDATGYKGIRTRRQAVRDLNGLLIRFRQREIANSDSFHLLDLDLTTLGLAGLLAAPLVGVLLALMLRLQISPGLSNALLVLIGKRAGFLLAGAVILLLIHHLYFVKRNFESWVKWLSLGVFTVIFSTLSVALLTSTRSEMLEQKVSYHCIMRFHADSCREMLTGLSEPQREQFLQRVEELRKSLVRK